MNNKYIDIKVIRIGLLTGIMGAGLMIYLGTADLGLGNFLNKQNNLTTNKPARN